MFNDINITWSRQGLVILQLTVMPLKQRGLPFTEEPLVDVAIRSPVTRLVTLAQGRIRTCRITAQSLAER